MISSHYCDLNTVLGGGGVGGAEGCHSAGRGGGGPPMHAHTLVKEGDGWQMMSLLIWLGCSAHVPYMVYCNYMCLIWHIVILYRIAAYMSFPNISISIVLLKSEMVLHYTEMVLHYTAMVLHYTAISAMQLQCIEFSISQTFQHKC